MKSAMKFLVLLFTVLILTNTAFAESPREQLKQMVEQLQKTPTDDALREKIIKLAQELKPALVIPEEAERRMARGTAAFKGAKSVADYRDAAKEFEQATLAAPWYSDAYLNLGVAQDKAENYEAALHSLKLALLASPNDKEIKALIYEVEYRNEKADSPEVRAMKQKTGEESFLRSIDGARFRKVQNYGDAAIEIIFEVRGQTMVETHRLLSIDRRTLVDIDGMSTPGQTKEDGRFTWRNGAFIHNDASWLTYVVSQDGGTLTKELKIGADLTRDENYAVRQ